MNIDKLQETLIFTDKIFDYIPVVSTLTNINSLIIKLALKIFELINTENYKRIINENPLIKHYHDKSVINCIALCIPIFNFAVALSRDFPQPSLRDRRLAQEKLIADLETTNKEWAQYSRDVNSYIHELETEEQKRKRKQLTEKEKLEKQIEEQRQNLKDSNNSNQRFAYAMRILALQDDQRKLQQANY